MVKPFAVLVALLFAGLACAADVPPSSLGGRVLEVKDVDSYTYLRLRTKDGEIWAAVNRTPVKVGADVTIDNPAVMNNFESRTLGKKFDRIIFGTIGTPGGGVPAAHAGMAKSVDVGSVKVAKASGADARTVAEVNLTKADLKGKTVAVRGKVVKFTPGVMGKNWVHLRDGTGSDADGSNDILVTTMDETKVGDVVLAKGTVATDRDFGAGYAYKVLIEGAALAK